MAIFEDVKFHWKGTTYVIPSNRVLEAIAEVEEVLTLDEIGRYFAAKKTPTAKLSRAYGIVLRFAGAKISDDEVYLDVLKDGKQSETAYSALIAMLAMMLPPEALKKSGEKKGNGAENPTQRRRRGRARNSSKSTSNEQSAPAG